MLPRGPPPADWSLGSRCLRSRSKTWSADGWSSTEEACARAGAVLTQGAGALGLGALVLWEVEAQRAVPQSLGDLAQIVHQVSAQRVVQQGVPQRGGRAEVVPRHRGAETDGRKRPLTDEQPRGRRKAGAEEDGGAAIKHRAGNQAGDQPQDCAQPASDKMHRMFTLAERVATRRVQSPRGRNAGLPSPVWHRNSLKWRAAVFFNLSVRSFNTGVKGHVACECLVRKLEHNQEQVQFPTAGPEYTTRSSVGSGFFAIPNASRTSRTGVYGV